MQLRLATVNVLYEMYYVHYAEPDTDITTIGWRINAFHKALENPQALQGLDILCFQEWPYTDYMVHARKNESIEVQGKAVLKGSYFPQAVRRHYKEFNELLLSYYPEKDYYYCRDAQSKNGVLTVISKKCGRLQDYGFRTLERNKEFCYAKVRIAEKNLMVINAHLPFFDNEAYIRSIEQFAKNYASDGIIIAGDFNYNIWHAKKGSINNGRFNRLKELFSGYTVSADLLPQPTALAASGKALNLVDFFFIKGDSLAVDSLAIYPQIKEPQEGVLVSYSLGSKPIRSYFSDHAILRLDLAVL